VIILTVKYAGPLMVAGLCILGWLKLWSRPDLAFAVIYAVGIFVCFGLAALFALLQPPYVWSTPGLSLSISRFVLWGVVAALVFVGPAAGIVAISRRLGRRE
jgi:hypothetical protein